MTSPTSQRIALLVGGGLDVCAAPELAARLRGAGYDVVVRLSVAAQQLVGAEAFRLAGVEITDQLPPDGPVLLCPADAAALELCRPANRPVAGIGGVATEPTPLFAREDVLLAARWLLSPRPLAGRTVLITAGPTAEDLDPVRFLTNRSTGRMGLALATTAACLGARALLVHGPLTVRCPTMPGVTAIPVRSAREMHTAVMARVTECDAAILCAAVADFTPSNPTDRKIKKSGQDELVLTLTRTPDILASLGALDPRPYLVGFAAETHDLERYAQDKLRRKNCDLMCANDVAAADSGFAVATNRITIFRRDAAPLPLPLLDKEAAAERILLLVAEALNR